MMWPAPWSSSPLSDCLDGHSFSSLWLLSDWWGNKHWFYFQRVMTGGGLLQGWFAPLLFPPIAFLLDIEINCYKDKLYFQLYSSNFRQDIVQMYIYFTLVHIHVDILLWEKFVTGFFFLTFACCQVSTLLIFWTITQTVTHTLTNVLLFAASRNMFDVKSPIGLLISRPYKS